MPFNLALDQWISVVRKDGSSAIVAPWEITSLYATNPIVAVDTMRQPWNGALTEFLQAIFQTTLFPDDAREWRGHWDDPPSPEKLKHEISKIAKLFDLAGDIPFMQDRTLLSDPEKLETYRKPVQKLLVDGVSEQQELKNSDLFVKSGTISALCLRCAAATLWDLQIHAPQGSASYYTSPRGGGPVSTLVSCDTLWKTVWANVLEQAAFEMKGRPDPKSFMPWISPVQKTVKSKDECPLHIFWPMPRRVFLEVTREEAVCDTCGSWVKEAVRTFLTYRGGLKYAETDWRHPLSPYVRSKEDGWLVRRTESDLAGYRHWMGLLVDTPSGDGMPAFVVRRWFERDALGEPELHLWGFGYQTDQASVKVWCEGRTPFIVLANGRRKEYEAFVRTLVALSQRAVERLTEAASGAVKNSGRQGGVNTAEAQQEFWRVTEPLFLEEIRAGAADPSKENLSKRADDWVKTVQRKALSLYERFVPFERVRPEWLARYAHRLRRKLSSRDPATMKTRKYGDWRITDV